MAISNALILQSATVNRVADAVNVSTAATGADVSGEEFGLAFTQQMQALEGSQQDLKGAVPASLPGQAQTTSSQTLPLAQFSSDKAGLQLLNGSLPLAAPVSLASNVQTPLASETMVTASDPSLKPTGLNVSDALSPQLAASRISNDPLQSAQTAKQGDQAPVQRDLPLSALSANPGDQAPVQDDSPQPALFAKPGDQALSQNDSLQPLVHSNVDAAKNANQVPVEAAPDKTVVQAISSSDVHATQGKAKEEDPHALIHQMKAFAGQVAQMNEGGNASKLESGKDLPESKPLKEKLKSLADTPDSPQPLLQAQPEPAVPLTPIAMSGGFGLPVSAPENAAPQFELNEDADDAEILKDVLSASGKSAPAQSLPAQSGSAQSDVGALPGILNQALGVNQPKSSKDEVDFADLLNQSDQKVSIEASSVNGVTPDQSLMASDVNAAKAMNPVSNAKESAPAPAPLDKPLGQPGWSDELGERVVWMAGKNMQSAELHINPPHLGPMEIRIHMHQQNQSGQASIEIVSQHAAVRDAVEASIPKLREMMGSQQLDLVDVNVSQQSFTEQRDNRNAQLASDRQSGGQSQSGRGFDGQSSHEGSPVYPESEAHTTAIKSNSVLSLYA